MQQAINFILVKKEKMDDDLNNNTRTRGIVQTLLDRDDDLVDEWK